MSPPFKPLPFVKLTSFWDHPPEIRRYRHSVELPLEVERTLDVAKRYKGKLPLKGTSTRTHWLEDFPFAVIPIMSERAADALADLLSPHGEFLPLRLTRDGKRLPAKYVVFNCLEKADILDRRILKPEDWLSKGWLSPYATIRYRPTLLPKHLHAFRVTDEKLPLYVSMTVRQRLLASNLSGWALFEPYYQTKAEISKIIPKRG